MFACLVACTSVYDPPPNLAIYVDDQARENGVPPGIAEALIERESHWNPFASRWNANGTRDEGIMQLNNRTRRWLERRYNDGKIINPYNPYDNVRLAMRYLGDLYSVTGSWSVALQAYNAGIGTVWQGDVPAAAKVYAKRIEQMSF